MNNQHPWQLKKNKIVIEEREIAKGVDENQLSGRIFSLSRSKSYTIVPSKDNEDAAATNNVMLSHLDTMEQKTKQTHIGKKHS